MKKYPRGLVSFLLATSLILTIPSCSSKKSGKEESNAASQSGSVNEDIAQNGSSSDNGMSTNMTSSENSAPSQESLPAGTEEIEATFLGVSHWGEPETKKENADSFTYRFDVEGREKTYFIDNSKKDSSGTPLYPIQNMLKEGYRYKILVKDNTIVGGEEFKSESTQPFRPVVSGTPGKRTVLNFIQTALMPVGTTLYVFGGGWDWQDTGSSIQSRTIGVSDDWVKFFSEQDVNYTFRDKDDDPEKRDPKTSYYPFGGFNEYYYAGLDCSGFVGWTLYNTMNTESGKEGYVVSSTKMAKKLSETYGYGDYSGTLGDQDPDGYKLRPGDVVSLKGHVWISLGTCDDGSVVIVHSTNGYKSKTGQPGGGVAIGAIGYTKDCQAYQLASRYMTEYYPEWCSRYDLTLSDPDHYLKIEGDTAGRFTWNTSSSEGLSDPDGVQNMKPDQVLKICFGE